MAGERYGYSIDIGKELEKADSQEEKPEKKPKSKPKEQPEEEISEKELAIEEQDIKEKILSPDTKIVPSKPKEQPEDMPSEKELAVEEQEIKEKIIRPDVEEVKTTAKEELDDEEPYEVPRPPDPIEDDVNEIITKEYGLYNGKPSFFKKLIKSPMLLFLLGVILVGGWFVAKANYNEEVPVPVLPQIEPVPIFEEVELSPANNISENAATVDELPNFFSDKLRDY